MPTLSLNASKKTKQTPAGEIPVDWGWSELTKVAKIQTGLSKSSSRQGDFIRLPYLRVANVQDGHFNLSEIKKIDVPKDSVERYSIKKGDVLLTEGGDYDKLGRGAIWQGQISPCVHQNHIFVVRPNEELLDTRFFAYQSSGPRGRAYFQSCAKQSTNLASINSSQLKEFPAFLPPLPEQKKIADILGTWDTALEKLDALIAAKTRRKQALMQQLLTGKKRLPAFSGDWRDVKIGTLFKEVKRPVKWNDDHLYKLVSVRRRSGGFFYRQPLRGKDIKTKVMFTTKAGDFVIAKMQVLHGALAMTPEAFDNAHVSGSYITLVPKNEANFHVSYFDWLSRTPRLYHLALISSYGVMIEKMTFVLRDFLKHEVLIPPTKAEQTAIAQVLDTADAEINLLKKQRTALDQQKRGLMQKLLTGKVRVKA